MHEYDVVLKRILIRPGSGLLKALTGASSLRWLNVEFPKVNNRRVDLLGESRSGELIQIELQARNEKNFPFRMAEYLFDIGRRCGRFPRQIALYLGEPGLRMKDSIDAPDLSFRFNLIDIRNLDGEKLLVSRSLADNVIAILTRIGEQPDTVRRILKRIAVGAPGQREQALVEFAIISGLRRLSGEVKREARKMPILLDIMDNEMFGPQIQQGRTEGQMEILLRLAEKKFGPITPRMRKRLIALKPAQIKTVALRLLDADRIEDLFAR